MTNHDLASFEHEGSRKVIDVPEENDAVKKVPKPPTTDEKDPIKGRRPPPPPPKPPKSPSEQEKDK